MTRYQTFAKTFIMVSAITSRISTVTIEIRNSIHSSRQPAFKNTGNKFSDIYNNIIYILRTLPYKFSSYFNLLNKEKKVPEYISSIYTFLLSFIIALSVYHLFLAIFGYRFFYLYFFGLKASKKYAPRNLKI